MLNLSLILEDSALKFPTKTAFILDEKQISFEELNQQASAVAGYLTKNGLQKDDKAALTCPNIFYFPIIYFGILKAGGTVVPLNVLLKTDEIKYYLKDSEAKFYFCFEGTTDLPMGKFGLEAFNQSPFCNEFLLLPSGVNLSSNNRPSFQEVLSSNPVKSYLERTAEDIAVILYTSGTTGKAKGAQLTHSNMLTNALVVKDLFKMNQEERLLVSLPLFHSFGQTVLMNTSILCGATAVLQPKFTPKSSLELLKSHKITIFASVPTMYWAIIHHPEVLEYAQHIKSHIRLSASGGAALPLQILEDFKKLFDAPILEGYGLSETSPVACFNHLDKPNKAGSIGTPVWGVQMDIHDKNGNPLEIDSVGEVVIRGHNIMQGYLNKPDANIESLKNGWFYTGDLGKKDKDGYFYIVDRTKDMIIKSGFNIYPREIEECLVTHPKVSLAAVIGIPDAVKGEEVKAFIVLKEGEEAKPKELLKYCAQKIADYKVPKFVEIIESLPMSATGKILKRELKA